MRCRRPSSEVALRRRLIICVEALRLRCSARVPGQRGYVKMSIVRAAAIVLWGATVVLGGCGTTNLKPDAPPGANLAGSWKLDHSASDDPQKTLDHMRSQANHIITRQLQAQGQSAPPM